MTGRPATTDIPTETAAAIAGNVALVQDKLLRDQGIAPDAWAEAVAYLSGFIERQRLGAEDGAPERLTSVLGSYLGEAIVQLNAGRWVQTENGIGVEAGGILCFPFNKVSKQFENGIEDSVLSFVNAVPALIARSKKEDAP